MPCEENSDALVEFNITVMRGANQGFFDVAVSFEDVFCSAKFDCLDANDDALTLLHDESGERKRTAVFAVACTDGADGGSTQILMDDLVIACTDGFTYPVDVTAAGGNLLSPALSAATADIFQAAIYSGLESLTCGVGDNGPISCGKAYWNTAIGLGDKLLTRGTCTATSTFTAGSGFVNGFTPPGVYPTVELSVPVSSAGAFVCTRHPLDTAGASGLATDYTDASSDGFPFANVGAVSGDAFTRAEVAPVDLDGTVATAKRVQPGKDLLVFEEEVGAVLNPKTKVVYDTFDYIRFDGLENGETVQFLVSQPCCNGNNAINCRDCSVSESEGVEFGLSRNGGLSFETVPQDTLTNVTFDGQALVLRVKLLAPGLRKAYEVDYQLLWEL